MPKSNPSLREGQRVRLTPGGPVYTVARVNECAAYLKGGEPREVTVTDKDGTERTFVASCAQTIAVSPCAFVEEVSDGE